jgi:hypothetical protein
MNVSLFKQIKDTTGGHTLGITEMFDSITNGHWIEHVDRVRAAKDKASQREIKKSVPYFTASGTFQHRKDDGLVQHSGVIAIDFDNLDDVKDIKSWLALDRFSWFTCESVSGNGLCVFVKIDPTKHRESFDYLSEYYLQNYKLEIDQACKDISRPRFVTYDPDGVLNQSAERLSFDREREFDPERIIGIAENMLRNSNDGERHNQLLKAARLMGGYIGSGLLDESTVEQRLNSCWMERGADEKYTHAKTIADGIMYGKNSPITIEAFKAQTKQSAENKKRLGMIFKHAREINRAGRSWDSSDVIQLCELHLISKSKVEQIFKTVFDEEKHMFGFDDKPKFVKTEIVIADNWEFRRNVVTQSTDARIRKDRNSKFIKVNFDTVARFAQHCGMITSPDKIKSLLRSDFVPEYDPIKSYFLNLPDWDGKTDYIKQFGDHVKCKDQKFWCDMLKKHMVRSIEQIMDGRVNRFVLVLVGEKQATGKSTFVRSLSPFPLGEYYTESKVRDDKDGQFSFAENFIYNIEELSDMKNGDVNRLKAIISQAIIKERKPYGHDVESIPRRCSFFGSTNNAQFLTDTENTRWLCHDIQSIDWGYSKINIHDVWSQAWTMYQQKFESQLTKDESEFQSMKNKNYEVSDIGKELISKCFKVCDRSHKKAVFMTTADIIEHLLLQTNGNFNFQSRIIGKYMIQLEFLQDRKRVNGNVARGYYVEKIVGAYMDENENEPNKKLF